MNRSELIVSIVAMAYILAGCASARTAGRGFLVGVVGGPMLVDEQAHGEYEAGSFHSAMKGFAHISTLVLVTPFLWPFTAAYGGASGVYGAYHFIRHETAR